MSDIRSFFSAKPKKTENSGTTSAVKSKQDTGKAHTRRPKPLVSSSDDDDDFVSGTPQPKKSKQVTAKKKPDDKETKPKEKSSPKMKAVEARDFFASSSSAAAPPAAKKKKVVSPPNENKGSKANAKCKESDKGLADKAKKRKSPDVELHDDPDFAAMLVDMDAEMAEVTPSPMKKPKTGDDGKASSKLAKLKSQAKPKEATKSPPKSQTPPAHEEKVKAKSPQNSVSSSRKSSSPIKGGEKTTSRVPTSPKSEPSQSKQAAAEKKAAGPSRDFEVERGESQLWVDKYKPSNVKAIIGQQGDKSNMAKLISWLRAWDRHHGPGATGKPPPRPPPWGAANDNGLWAKAALLSGSPGVGKTTTAYLVAKELGYEVTELNASDTRSKKQLDSVVADALGTRWVTNTSAKKILLMDEVDGMAGNEDRGGVGELIQLMKGSKIPIVCMCNDRNHQKIRNLANYCFDLRFHKPRVEQIKAAMMSVCFKEKVKIAPDALTDLIVGCNQDIRQVLYQLSMLKAKSGEGGEKLTASDIKSETERSQKTSIKMGPWDVCRKVFSSTDHKSMSLMDKSDLFFHDYSLGPLFVQENYLSAVPKVGENDKKKHMLLLSKASDSLCDGDLVEATIRSRNSWNLLPVQAMFSSVLPGEFMSGYMRGQIQFPNWLGKYSKQNKMDRLLQEAQMHTRLSANLSKQALNRDFIQHLRDAIVSPLASEGAGGVDASVEVMQQYSLLREDLDNVLELAQWPDRPDPMRGVESKVKAAFTRAYNKQVSLPYSTNVGNVAKKASKVIEADPAAVEDQEEEDDEDDDDITKDTMIKPKKKTGKSEEGKATKGGRGRASGGAAGTSKGEKPAGGRGRGKKK